MCGATLLGSKGEKIRLIDANLLLSSAPLVSCDSQPTLACFSLLPLSFHVTFNKVLTLGKRRQQPTKEKETSNLLLKALHTKERQSTIYVKVLRKWEFYGTQDNGPIQHIDLVLADEKGNAIYGEIPPAQIERHNPLLQVGGIYIIDRFKVCNTKSQFKPVDRQYMIEFTCHTIINVARNAPSTFPNLICSPISFSEIPFLLGDRKKLLDVTSVIIEVAELAWAHLSSQPNPTLTRNIFLRDTNGLELKVTLWGQQAIHFHIDTVYDADQHKLVVVLFVGGLIKKYQTCHWYFNPEILEAEVYYNRDEVPMNDESAARKDLFQDNEDTNQEDDKPLPKNSASTSLIGTKRESSYQENALPQKRTSKSPRIQKNKQA